MPLTALKACWTVRAGMYPGEAEMLKDLSKQWLYTAEDYAADCELTKGETPGPHPEKPPTKFETCRKEAVAYWESLNEPSRLNWAELSFAWL